MTFEAFSEIQSGGLVFSVRNILPHGWHRKRGADRIPPAVETDLQTRGREMSRIIKVELHVFQFDAQNLGASLGTALIGSVLLTGLTIGFATRVETNPALPSAVQTKIAETAKSSGLVVVPADQVSNVAHEAGLPTAQADAVAQSYADALLQALRDSLAAVAALAKA